MKEEAPNYLMNFAPECEWNTRTRNSIPTFNCWSGCFKHSFFPSTLNNLFNLDLNIRNSESISIFKSRLLSFIHPVQTIIYNIFDPKGLAFLTRRRLRLSILMSTDFDTIFINVWIHYVPVVLNSKILHIIFRTAITFHTIVLFL